MRGADLGTRLSRLREAFTEKALDGVLITSLNDIYYYTGKAINRPDPGFLLVTKKAHILYVSTLDNSLAGPGVRVLDDFKVLKSELRGAGSLGFDERNMMVATYRKLPTSSWKPLSDSLKSLRMVKDMHEISQIREACRRTARILSSLEMQGKSGLQLSAEIHNTIRLGGDTPAFDPIVASGKNSAFIHTSPTRDRIGRGLTIVDMGICYNHYNSDVTRTYLSDPTPEESALMEQCTSIQLELRDMATPGTKFSDIQKRYEALMKPLGHKVMHGFGHGVGLGIHERPGTGDTLEKGMVLTVEPGIYKKGLGGCRIEDTILVSDKPVVLSR